MSATAPSLRDANGARRLDRDGWAVVPWLDAAGAAELLALHLRLRPTPARALEPGLLGEDPEAKRAADAAIRARFAPALHALLPGWRAVVGSFVHKAPGPGGAMRPHQDWNVVDETAHESLNIWVPLCDVDRRNGCLCVVEGSQRLRGTVRGSGLAASCAALTATPDGGARWLRPVPMRGGDALVYFHRVVHASPPNTGGSPRVAAMLTAVPEGAPLRHYRRGDDGAVECWEIADRFFLEFGFGANALPAGCRHLGTLADAPAMVTPQALRALRRRDAGRRVARWWQRRGERERAGHGAAEGS